MSATVHTQAELDAALAAKVDTIYVESPDGVWLRISDEGSSHVEAWGSSHVEAWGSSHVEAWGSSHVEARDSSHVEARGSSHVVAWGSSHVEAWGSSHVEAWGSSHVEAWGSSHVEARDSSHVEARDSSHVEAWGSSHVEARDSSHVVARDSSHVVAWDSSHVEAAKYVAVHLHSQRVTLAGGVVIDLTSIDLTDRETWLGYHGVNPVDGTITLYKSVDPDLWAGHGYRPTQYPIGGTVTAPDWNPAARCGGGLHLSPTAAHARSYYNGAGKPRFLAVQVDAGTFVALNDKVKVQTCRVVGEVDLYGRPLAAAVAS